MRDWRKDIDSVFNAKGISRLGSWQAETIYRTESSMAYGAGSFAKQLEVSDRFPFWEFLTADDGRVRASHRALQGKIFNANDKHFYPPVGFNCRCRGKSISRLQAEKRGISGPDTVTQEMLSNLGNAEFIGDKIKSFEDYLREKIDSLDDIRAQMIIDKISEIKQNLGTKTHKDSYDKP
jgi:SPP1 gp7 family putative phage head morphogenesis protein